MRKQRYPGRHRVIHRDDARDILWREQVVPANTVNPCRAPVVLSAIGLPGVFDKNTGKLPLELRARCRRCPECLAHRARLWTARAIDEIKASERTWFGTLTVAPEQRFVMRMKASLRSSRRAAMPIEALSEPERFAYLAYELNREATKWLKRVRAASAVPLRYLLVTEAHKSGDPHLHLLLHEQGAPVRKALLEEQWRHGFSHWRLVDREPSAAVYACKYLAKALLTRVRASGRYGQVHLVHRSAERAEEAAFSLAAVARSSEADANRESGISACLDQTEKLIF